ncbi:MAG: hypothetical protein KC468_10145 [Myxococcales bacterium]|nr:hypothetical protein [Myxococcales bacterium]
MRAREHIWVAFAGLIASACFASNPDYVPPEDATGETARPTSTSDADTSTGAGASTGGSSSVGGSSSANPTTPATSGETSDATLPSTVSSSFTSDPGTVETTGEPPVDACNPYLQNCDDMEEKCSAKDSDADGYLDELTCAGFGDGPIGGMCSSNPNTGDDTCGPWLFCAGGQCREICSGSPDDPMCLEGDTTCFAYKELMPICVPQCVPLAPEPCDNGVCVPVPGGEDFACAPEGLGGTPEEPCKFANDCAPGLVCVDADQLPDCGGSRCCTSLCLIGNEPCPPGYGCTSYGFPNHPNVGFCGAP